MGRWKNSYIPNADGKKNMKRRKVDSGLERQFITALITSKPFLASADPVIDLDLIQSPHFRQIAEWCIEYFRKYDDAPGRGIESIYYAWAENQEPTDTTVDAIHDLLGYLSDQYDAASTINVPHLVDELGTYLSMRSLARVEENLQSALARGDHDAAKRAVDEYTGIDLGQGVGFDPLNDRGAWERAFAAKAEPLITYGGDAGSFLNPGLTRDSLIGIQGPEKRGKTMWCLELAMRALRDGRKVAVFEVGDLSESQIMLRMGVRLSALPMWQSQVGDILVPRKLVKKSDDEIEQDEEDLGKGAPKVNVIRVTKHCPTTVSYRACRRACRKWTRACGMNRKQSNLMVAVYPNSSINVAGIEAVLKRWRHERDFVPDVIIIDYADILAPESSRKDARHEVNDTWKALRRLSQEWHSLVIAPTQANAASYTAETQSMRNFSEDKRKLAHVTGMLGLNQTKLEKEVGVMRLNWLVLREYDFLTERCLHVAQCLALGRAYVCGVL
jgi:archaellum biogenesis ATPase FlaH